jgi:hypothetical protein
MWWRQASLAVNLTQMRAAGLLAEEEIVRTSREPW